MRLRRLSGCVSGIALIRISQLHAIARNLLHRLRELLDLRPILFIGRGDMQRQQVTQGVDCRVHFGALAPLGAVVARPRARLRRGLYRAAVDYHGTGLSLASCVFAQQQPQIVHHRLEAAGAKPSLHLLIHRRPWRKVVRHHAPVRTAAHQPAQGIEHRTQIVVSLLAVQLLTRIRETFAVELSLDLIYSDKLTIRRLAAIVDNGGQVPDSDPGQLSEAEYAALLAEVESLSDEEVQALLGDAQ